MLRRDTENYGRILNSEVTEGNIMMFTSYRHFNFHKISGSNIHNNLILLGE
jgi:hypothetical protein